MSCLPACLPAFFRAKGLVSVRVGNPAMVKELGGGGGNLTWQILSYIGRGFGGFGNVLRRGEPPGVGGGFLASFSPFFLSISGFIFCGLVFWGFFFCDDGGA